MKPSHLVRVLFGCVLCSALVFAPPAHSQATLTLFSVDQSSDQLRTIDPVTAQTTATITMTLAGQTILGANGLALHPQTGVLWVALRLQGQTDRFIGTVNPTTGVVTSVGNTGQSIAGIAFDCAGTLYGVTGENTNAGNVPEAVFILNQSTGAATLLTRLGRGDDGEAIGFNPLDNMLYHASGHSGDFDPASNSGVSFERFDPTNPPFNNIVVPANLNSAGEVQALAFQASTGNFLWKADNAAGPLFSVTPAGVATLLGTMDHQAKGLAFSGTTLFSVSSSDLNLRTINPATGATISSVPITLVGAAIQGLTGLAVHPTNGTVFALLNTGGVSRELVTINTGTGAATSIGSTGDRFAAIAFDAAGTLWGVTGSGANIPQALFTINTTNAATTYRYPVERNNSGVALAFNSANGNLYYASGSTTTDMTFERVVQTALPVDISVAGGVLTGEETQALTFEASSGSFLWKQNHGTGPLFRVTPAGAATQVGNMDMDHQAKGLSYAGPGAIACSANIGVTKTDSPDPVTLGSNITYTITITNAGPNPAVGVAASDAVPANVSFVSATGSQGTCTLAAGTVSCNVGTIPAGGMASATVVVTANAMGTVTNTVNVTAMTSDPSAANNSATATTTVSGAAGSDFSISATPAVANASPGGSATFTVSVAPVPVGSTFAGQVTYSCFVQPQLGTCSVSPVTVNVPSSSTLTVNVPSFSAAPPMRIPPMLLWLVALGMALVGVGIASRRLGYRRLAHCTAAGMLLLVASLVIFQSACTTTSDTITGPYVVTVSGSSPGGLSHSTTVTVNVQ